MKEQNSSEPALVFNGDHRVLIQGNWTITGIAAIEAGLKGLSWPPARKLTVHGEGIRALDTAGAMMLYWTFAKQRKDGKDVVLQGFRAEHLSLYELIAEHAEEEIPPPHQRPNWLESLGRGAVEQLVLVVGFLSFLGKNVLVFLSLIRHPHRIRVRAIGYHIETTGFNALPIIGLLTFLIGIVIAYQGGVQLQLYGADIYIVDLVGLSVAREFAPLITAILVAGRTGSAFAAQLSTMKVTEEVDAIRVLGIDPMEILVLPKLFALLIVMPLLTTYADVMGILGGMMMAGTMLDVSATAFLERFPDAVSVQSYLSGIVKAPFFAVIVTLVGCYQGLLAEGSAESVGVRTTMSVVQAIFLIIVTDALFSILFSWLGI